MEIKDKKRFAEVMMTMAEACSAQISKQGLQSRFLLLQRFSIETVEAAAYQIINTWRKAGFMPTHAEFMDVMGCSAVTIEDESKKQVAEVLSQVRSIGSYGSPKFKDEITNLLMSTRWRWSQLCAMTEVEAKWWAKEFMDAYMSAATTKNSYGRIEYQEKVKGLIENIGKVT